MSSVNLFAPAFEASARFDPRYSSLAQATPKKGTITADSPGGPDRDKVKPRRTRHQSGLEVLSSTLAVKSPSMSDNHSLSQDNSTSVPLSSFSSARLESLHSSRFPHPNTSQTTKTSIRKSSRMINAKLRRLKPPLYVDEGFGFRDTHDTLDCLPHGRLGQRQHHLSMVSAIMHRCLLEGDCLRAGRAWGLLLRGEVNGHSVNPRSSHRWGLGAEILLRSEAQRLMYVPEQSADGSTFPEYLFGSDGVEKAKDYYERLILQYPYCKASPHSTGPMDFYIAMFGLWICSVVAQESLAKRALVTASYADSEKSTIFGVVGRQYERKEMIRRETLRGAQEIADRLEQLLSSPPYTDRTEIWKLRGMVGLWMADLIPTVLVSNSSTVQGVSNENLNTVYDRTQIPSQSDGLNDAQSERARILAKSELAFQHALSLKKSLTS